MLQVADPEKEKALAVACRAGDAEATNTLLAAGCRLDAPDAHGWRPLHSAAANGRLECLQALLAAGARTHDADNYGWRFVGGAEVCVDSSTRVEERLVPF